MTLSQALAYAVQKLESAGVENARFDSRCLLERFANVGLTEIMMGSGELLKADFDAFDSALDKRISGYPLQYILEEWEFMGITFSVGEGVLIPRPETELLVELALKRIEGIDNPVVFDLCSGSGCIGLSISKFRPDAQVYLFEKYDAAFSFLEKNCRNIGNENVHAVKFDITLGADALRLPKPDVIVSNPPYIRSDEMNVLQPEVLCEPSTALDGGEDGMDFYRIIANKWQPIIKRHGSLIVECDSQQTIALARMFMPQCLKVSIISDLNGLQRVVCADT
ncbi:MAG: peptide chain release factor N(5)-glutamine methyltransferase [Oscillospiraceae bacterium]|nr:peptide chain release factor N(5)-glutamine methyltransferase [Oscillospiraceae bacterium]